MITFQQIRNATTKLYYPGVVFMIDPWLMDECPPEERDRAVATRSFIPRPICPLPAPAEELIADVDFFLLTHFHPDHFSPLTACPQMPRSSAKMRRTPRFWRN